MSNRQFPRSRGKPCDREECNRITQKGSNYCFWHTEVTEKASEDLKDLSGNRQLKVRGAYLRNADLEGVDFFKVKFPEANLIAANLSDANLSDANLSDANLSDANLSDANLSDANLSDANLSGANLSEANLSDANLSDANLSGARLFDANLSGANLSEANLDSAFLRGADLTEANLTNANFRSDLDYLVSISSPSASLANADLSGANLTNADLNDADLTDASLHNADLDTNFEGVDFGYDWVSPHTRLGDVLRPTPYTPQTYWELPKDDPDVYFCYFTSREYRKEESQYRLLDETLLHFGAYAESREVITVDRNKIPDPLWYSILDELNIKEWPALTVSQTPLGFEEVQLADETFNGYNDGKFVKLEKGIISDNILNDSDDLKDFLNSLHKAAKDGSLERTMTQEKFHEMLSIASEKVEKAILFSLSQ